ncbi:MAG TPA: MFS transporter [Micromonosporaceae bacterium]
MSFLVNRDFARLWYGQAISSVGDFVFDTTLVIWISYDLLPHSSWAPAAVSGLMLFALAGIIIVGPLAGVFVDRWSHRRIMLNTEVVRGILVGGLTCVALIPRHDLPVGAWLTLVYVVVFVVNAAGQFFNPSRFATIGEVVTGEVDQARAFGISQATASTASIIGPVLAAPLMITFGFQWALLVNALSYGVSYIAIRSVNFPATASDGSGSGGSGGERSSWRDEFTAGIRMFVRSRFLVALCVIAIVAQIGAGAISTLNVFFLTGNLHESPKLLGVLEMTFGAGGIVGALLAGRLVKAFAARRVIWVGLILSGIFFGAYARQTHIVAAMLLIFIFMLPVGALNTAISPMLIASTPPGFMGRMLAVFQPAVNAANVLSIVVAGALASTTLHNFHSSVGGVSIGPIDTIFTVAALLIAASGVYAAFTLPPAGTEAAGGTAAGDGAAGAAATDMPVPSQTVPAVEVIEPGVETAAAESQVVE